MRPVFFPSLTALFVVVVLALLGCSSSDQPPAPPATAESGAQQTQAAQPAPATSREARETMELLETTLSVSQDTIRIVGKVKNISPRDVSGVNVTCDFQTSTGSSVRLVQGQLATDPLPPDQISEFRVSTPYNAEIKRFNVIFQEMFGGQLVTKDSRKQ